MGFEANHAIMQLGTENEMHAVIQLSIDGVRLRQLMASRRKPNAAIQLYSARLGYFCSALTAYQTNATETSYYTTFLCLLRPVKPSLLYPRMRIYMKRCRAVVTTDEV